MVFETVRRARRRILAAEGMRYAAYAASAALAAVIGLLLAGTGVLGWIWPVLLPAAALAGGIYVTWRRGPSLYSAAQRVDRNLGLADTLSTALYFAGGGRATAEVRRAQWEQAERLAAGADPRRAIPLRMPRALYATALLAVIAVSLFALRYGLDRRLDLRPPLARVLREKLGYPAPSKSAQQARSAAPHDPRGPAEAGRQADDTARTGAAELDPAPDAALDSPGVPEGGNPAGTGSPSAPLEAGGNQGPQPEGLSVGADGSQPTSASQAPGGKAAGKPGAQQASGDSGSSSGMLGKLRDAMSSLLNRMRQPGGQGGQPREGAPGGRPNNQQASAGQNGTPGRQPGDARQSGAADGQPGEDSQNARDGQPGSPGESGEQAATRQPGSGIGRQDGNKDVKLAEQLAAMGKISEIIGKRSANVSGEVTVEVRNANQQLRTPYVPSAARHAEAGGEIHRDEIPVALQAYVQQYFEELRKQPAGKGAARARHRGEPAKPGL